MERPLTTALHRVPYHLGIATCDLDRARTDLGELFGVAWSPTRTVEGELTTVGAYAGPTRRLHSLGGPMRVEVIEGTRESVWATDRVAELHHYAYWSADVATDVAVLEALGWRVEMATVDDDGRPSVFAYLVKPGHIRVELLDDGQRPGYEAVVGVSVPTDVSVAFDDPR
jgi:glyoxalase/bleomycin resistance protein/dioxygenase superfamily protein